VLLVWCRFISQVVLIVEDQIIAAIAPVDRDVGAGQVEVLGGTVPMLMFHRLRALRRGCLSAGEIDVRQAEPALVVAD